MNVNSLYVLDLSFVGRSYFVAGIGLTGAALEFRLTFFFNFIIITIPKLYILCCGFRILVTLSTFND